MKLVICSIGTCVALHSSARLCSAQTATAGTFQMSSITSLGINRQTISPQDASGNLQPDVDVTSADVGLEATYYITPHFGIGGLVTYQRLSIAGSGMAMFEVSGGFFGPLAQVRLPLGDRSEFVLIASDGGVRVNLTNQNTGIAANRNSGADGRYWLAGGGVSFALNPSVSFDLGLQYQGSTFTGNDAQKATAAGLLVGIGFSYYIH